MGKNRVAQSRVHIRDEDGKSHAFNPGDEVPAYLAERVSSEAVWRRTDTGPAAGEVGVINPPTDMTLQPGNGVEPGLEELSYKQLLGMAKDANITFDGNPKKEDVIDALRAHELNGPDDIEDDDDEEDLD